MSRSPGNGTFRQGPHRVRKLLFRQSRENLGRFRSDDEDLFPGDGVPEAVARVRQGQQPDLRPIPGQFHVQKPLSKPISAHAVQGQQENTSSSAQNSEKAPAEAHGRSAQCQGQQQKEKSRPDALPAAPEGNGP